MDSYFSINIFNSKLDGVGVEEGLNMAPKGVCIQCIWWKGITISRRGCMDEWGDDRRDIAWSC